MPAKPGQRGTTARSPDYAAQGSERTAQHRTRHLMQRNGPHLPLRARAMLLLRARAMLPGGGEDEKDLRVTRC